MYPSPAVVFRQLKEPLGQNHQLMAGQLTANGLPPGGRFRRQQQQPRTRAGATDLNTDHDVTGSLLSAGSPVTGYTFGDLMIVADETGLFVTKM